MKIEKVLRKYKTAKLVKLYEPILGGYYAVINGKKAKTGLNLDAGIEIFNLIHKELILTEIFEDDKKNLKILD